MGWGANEDGDVREVGEGAAVEEDFVEREGVGAVGRAWVGVGEAVARAGVVEADAQAVAHEDAGVAGEAEGFAFGAWPGGRSCFGVGAFGIEWRRSTRDVDLAEGALVFVELPLS